MVLFVVVYYWVLSVMAYRYSDVFNSSVCSCILLGSVCNGTLVVMELSENTAVFLLVVVYCCGSVVRGWFHSKHTQSDFSHLGHYNLFFSPNLIFESSFHVFHLICVWISVLYDVVQLYHQASKLTSFNHNFSAIMLTYCLRHACLLHSRQVWTRMQKKEHSIYVEHSPVLIAVGFGVMLDCKDSTRIKDISVSLRFFAFNTFGFIWSNCRHSSDLFNAVIIVYSYY